MSSRTVVAILGFLLAGCPEAEDEPGSPAVDPAPPVVVDGDTLPLIRLQRVHREAPELAAHASRLASAVAGRPLAKQDALAWAETALDSSTGSIGSPFSSVQDVQLSYQAQRDLLTLSIRRPNGRQTPRVAVGAMDPEPGIGKERARRIANSLRTKLEAARVVMSGHEPFGTRRTVSSMKPRVPTEASVGAVWVEEYIFWYHRHRNGYPLFNSLLEIAIDRNGDLARIAVSEVYDEEAGKALAVRNEDDAPDLLNRWAMSRFSGVETPPEFHSFVGYTGYRLNPNEDVAVEAPRYFEQFTFVSERATGRRELAAVSFLDEDPVVTSIIGTSVATSTPAERPREQPPEDEVAGSPGR